MLLPCLFLYGSSVLHYPLLSAQSFYFLSMSKGFIVAAPSPARALKGAFSANKDYFTWNLPQITVYLQKWTKY